MATSAEPSTRQQRRKARTAAAILDAAERLFLRQGYQATTIEQLAEEADVAVGSLYIHFGSKPGIYAALIDRALELDKQYSDEGWEQGEDPVGRFVGIADGYLKFARHHPGLFRIFRFPPPDAPADGPVASASERVSARIRSETSRIAAALQQAIDEGTLRDLEPSRAAIFLWAAWDGLIAAHVLPGNMGLSDKQFNQVMEFGREALTRALLV